MVGMTKQRWFKLRWWVALAFLGVYLATLVLVVVSGGWHSQKVFSALAMVAALAMVVGAISQMWTERVTGPRKVRGLRSAVVVLVVLGLIVPGLVRLFIWPAFDPVTNLLLYTGMLVAALSMITGWTAPVPRAASAA